MGRLRKFLRLSAAEKRLLLKAALLLGTIKLCLKLLPFQTLHRLVNNLSKPSRRLAKGIRSSVEKVGWAVELAGRHVPGTCLTRAMAAQIMLARRGYPVLLHIGVAREAEEQFLAHAWLECEGRVIVGEYELERYIPLVALERARA